MNAREKTPDQLPIGGDAATSDVAVHAKLELSAWCCAIVAPFIAKMGEARYYLRGINVAPAPGGGAIICATNGHAMGIYHDKNAVCEVAATFKFDRGTLAACAVGGAERLVVMRNNRLAVIDQHGVEVYIQPGSPVTDGSIPYPSYDRVIPRAERLQRGMVAAVNGTLIGLVTQSTNVAERALRRSVYMRAIEFYNVEGDRNACTVARIADLPDFIAVLMPMRVDPVGTVLPEWLNAARSAA